MSAIDPVTLPDLKFAALRAQGFLGAIPEMTLAWLKANGATSDTIPDAWAEMLAVQLSLAGGVATGHRADDWYKLLELLGYATAGGRDLNQINERERLFWGNGGVFGPSPPIWGAIPVYTIYELPGNDFVLNLKKHCFANPDVHTWGITVGTVTNPPTDPDGILTITWADVGEGTHQVTVSATNDEGGPVTQQSTLIGIAGEQAMKPQFSTVPDFYSRYGVAGSGTEAPSVLAEDGGLDMNDYLLNPPVHPGSWQVTGPAVVDIDPNTGIITGRTDAAVNTYSIQAGATNDIGTGYCNVFSWTVLPADGWQHDFTTATIG